jgi:ornithine carbamoyltransferase
MAVTTSGSGLTIEDIGAVARGREVIDGPQSIVYDEAENRLHVQKALMALTMG